MSYSQAVKERAYSLDPACWVSYSGAPRQIKAYWEGRRVASLQAAANGAVICEPCSGRGVILVGPYSNERRCAICHGRGKVRKWQ